MLLGTDALVILGASAGMKRNIVASETRQPCPVSIGLTDHHFIQVSEQALLLAVVADASVASVTVEVAVGCGVVSTVCELTTLVTSMLVFDNTQVLAFDSAHTGCA